MNQKFSLSLSPLSRFSFSLSLSLLVSSLSLFSYFFSSLSFLFLSLSMSPLSPLPLFSFSRSLYPLACMYTRQLILGPENAVRGSFFRWRSPRAYSPNCLQPPCRNSLLGDLPPACSGGRIEAYRHLAQQQD